MFLNVEKVKKKGSQISKNYCQISEKYWFKNVHDSKTCSRFQKNVCKFVKNIQEFETCSWFSKYLKTYKFFQEFEKCSKNKKWKSQGKIKYGKKKKEKRKGKEKTDETGKNQK